LILRRNKIMADVNNWQLGRKMWYPYEEAHPNRQFAFVFNINRCIACQTCTMACKATWTFSKGQEFMWWNNVETKPYGGYPQFWDQKAMHLLEKANPAGQTWNASEGKGIYGTYKGTTIFEAPTAGERERGQNAVGYVPTDKEWRFPNIYEDTATGDSAAGVHTHYTKGEALPEHSGRWFHYLQRLCNHCTYPGCLGACPRKAIYKRQQDGIVLIDQARCRGYRKCVEQCPYKKPMYRSTTRISEKCIACYPRIEGADPISGGRPMETRCMAACVGQIRMQGLVQIDSNGEWKHDPQHPLYYLIKTRKVALPLYPQFGTEPNGYYIPARNAPRDYSKQMFGPGADHAVEQYLAPDRELLAVMNLFRKTQKIIFKFGIKKGPKVYETIFHGKPWAMYNDTVIGYGHDGKEIVRTTIEEPIHIRPEKHITSI
jgi:nitrate reductase beta subunit